MYLNPPGFPVKGKLVMETRIRLDYLVSPQARNGFKQIEGQEYLFFTVVIFMWDKGD